MTERIYVHVDDAELRELSSRLDNSMERMRKVDVDSFKLDSRTKAILTRLPGLREANALWREIQALSVAAAAEEGAAGMLATGSAVLMLLMVTVSMLKRIERFELSIIAQQSSYESMIREGLDLTHEEWSELDRVQRGYATAWEELVAGLRRDIPEAVEKYFRLLWAETFGGATRPEERLYRGETREEMERWTSLADRLESLKLWLESHGVGESYDWNLGDGPHQ